MQTTSVTLFNSRPTFNYVEIGYFWVALNLEQKRFVLFKQTVGHIVTQCVKDRGPQKFTCASEGPCMGPGKMGCAWGHASPAFL